MWHVTNEKSKYTKISNMMKHVHEKNGRRVTCISEMIPVEAPSEIAGYWVTFYLSTILFVRDGPNNKSRLKTQKEVLGPPPHRQRREFMAQAVNSTVTPSPFLKHQRHFN